MSSNLSEICRVESEVQDLAATLRVMIHLSITRAWPLFRNIFQQNPDLTAEQVFGAVLLVVGECSQPFDTDEVLRLCEEKLVRAIQFSRLVTDIPESRVVDIWHIYDGSNLPDSFFSSFGFQSAWAALESVRRGTHQPRTIN